MTKLNPFKWFKTSPEIIRLAVMMYVRFPLSLRKVEDLLHERGVHISHETVRFWWHRFGPMFASYIRKRRIDDIRSSHWRWHLDEMFVKINGERHYLWRAVDQEGEVLESFITKTRDKKAALKLLKKVMKKHGRCEQLVTDKLRTYGAALRDLGASERQETGRWLNNRAENSQLPFRQRERAMLRFAGLSRRYILIWCQTFFGVGHMGKINAAWHREHPMPKNPTVDQRIEWHLAHANACGCRAIHGKILEEIKRRGIKVPAGPAAT